MSGVRPAGTQLTHRGEVLSSIVPINIFKGGDAMICNGG